MKDAYYRIISKILSNGSLVLMYHSICDISKDPLRLSVSPKNFRNQIRFLKSKFRILHPDELIASKPFPEKSILLTFDDGYANNFLEALPVLKTEKVPAIFFVCSGYISKKKYNWDIDSAKLRPMTRQELNKFAKSPFVTIGGHTHTHLRLSTLGYKAQEADIVKNIETLESVVGYKPRLFAYPYGQSKDYNLQSQMIVSKYFDFGFNALPSISNNLYHRSEVPRFVVRNWDANELEIHLKESFPNYI